MTALPQHLLDLVPNAVHVHSRTDFPEHDCQGTQTLGEIAASAQALGMNEVFLTEHTTNPGVGQPHFFTTGDELGKAIRNRVEEVFDFAADTGFKLQPGLEANLMPNSMVDIPPSLAHNVVLVIASMHGHVPRSGEDIKNLLMGALLFGYEIDMIGHAQRFVNVYDVDWDAIFSAAADPERPTIIEANFNAWFSYGPPKLRRKGDQDGAAEAAKKEIHFLKSLGRSAAPVVVSLDIHNAGMWPTQAPEADWMPTFDHLQEYLELLFSCGITPDRIINRNLREWLLLPKSDRGKLMTWL